MRTPHDILVQNLKQHSTLQGGDESALRALPIRLRTLQPDEDLVSEGEKPQVCALVLDGVVARYHALADGKRQYLSFHLSGDLPDAHTLFLQKMDHAVCAVGRARLALIAHDDVEALFGKWPCIAYAFWRDTLINAAIFREAITNNSSRPPRARMAHLFCELYYRARSSGLERSGVLKLPLHQGQIGDALGMSLVTVNRTLQALRRTGAMEFRNGELTVRNWARLSEQGEFDSSYLHVVDPPEF